MPGHGPLAVSAGLDHVDQSAGDVGGVVLVVHWIVSVGSHVRTQRCAAFAGSDSAGSARGVQPWPSTQRVGKRGLGPAALVANGLDAESGPSRHGSEPNLHVPQSDLVGWRCGDKPPVCESKGKLVSGRAGVAADPINDPAMYVGP